MDDTATDNGSPFEAPDAQHFEGIEPHGTIDYMLRTTQQAHMQLSIMADTKANIVITVCTVAISIILSQLRHETLLWPMLTLAASALVALLLAVRAVFPTVAFPRDARGHIDKGAPSFNLLFFGHFAQLPPAEFYRDLGQLLRHDARVYSAIAHDIYGSGWVLSRKKYRYVRWAYLVLMLGLIATAVEVAALAALGILTE